MKTQRKTLIDGLNSALKGFIRSIMFWKTYNKKAQSVGNIDESFDVVPPYSNISLSHCLGFKASWEERKSFLRFLYNVLKTMAINGEKKIISGSTIYHNLPRKIGILSLRKLNNLEHLLKKIALMKKLD